jgi:hypothetical protein
MKLDTSREQRAMNRLAKRLDGAGTSMQQAGQNMMKVGCSIMLMGVIGLLLLAAVL